MQALNEPEPVRGRSLHRKLAQIMYEAGRIPKNGVAPREMGGYPFVQVGDAADAIRKALGEHVISMVPTKIEITRQVEVSTKAGGSMTVIDLMVDWTLTDGETGESIIIQSFGAGADTGDKYSGKAQTNAMKYALLMGFLLSTGDDPEGDKLPERGDEPPKRAPRAVLAATKPPELAPSEVDALFSKAPATPARPQAEQPPVSPSPEARPAPPMTPILPVLDHCGWRLQQGKTIYECGQAVGHIVNQTHGHDWEALSLAKGGRVLAPTEEPR